MSALRIGTRSSPLALGQARHVAELLGGPDAVLVLDPSAFPKKGTESCGVARQWCGRLGKVDNCQVGCFLAIAAPGGATLLRNFTAPPVQPGSEPTPAEVPPRSIKPF